MARFSLRSFFRRNSGAAVLEFALVAPLLFLIVWSIISFGTGYTRLNVLTGALRQGARVASTLPDPCGADKADVDSAVAQHAAAFGGFVDVSSLQYGINCGNPPEIRVGVQDYPLFSGLKFFGMDGLLVTREAIFRRELP